MKRGTSTYREGDECVQTEEEEDAAVDQVGRPADAARRLRVDLGQQVDALQLLVPLQDHVTKDRKIQNGERERTSTKEALKAPGERSTMRIARGMNS